MAKNFRCKDCGCELDTRYVKIGDILECEECKSDKEVRDLENTIGEEPKGRNIPKVIAILMPIGILSFSVLFRRPFDPFFNGLFLSFFKSMPELLGHILWFLPQAPASIVILYFFVNFSLSKYRGERMKFNPKPIRKALLQGVIAICLFEILLYIFR